PGPGGQPISKRFGPHLATGGVVSGRDVSGSDVMPRSNALALTNEKPLVSKGFDASGRLESASVVSTPDRIRTYNLRFRRRGGELSKSHRPLDLLSSYTKTGLLQEVSSLRMFSQEKAVFQRPSR